MCSFDGYFGTCGDGAQGHPASFRQRLSGVAVYYASICIYCLFLTVGERRAAAAVARPVSITSRLGGDDDDDVSEAGAAAGPAAAAAGPAAAAADGN